MRGLWGQTSNPWAHHIILGGKKASYSKEIIDSNWPLELWLALGNINFDKSWQAQPKSLVLPLRHKRSGKRSTSTFNVSVSKQELSLDAWVMKSTGTFRDTIKIWERERERALSLMTQKLWRHAVTADGGYDQKKKGQEETNCLQTAWVVLTERFSSLSERMRKVTNCDSVVLFQSMNYIHLF